MRKIDKSAEPERLKDWKRANPLGRYSDIGGIERDAIRTACLAEQFYLCAYCCQSISGNGDCMNEHVEARHIAPHRSLDFQNIVASCTSPRQCDAAHRAQVLPLTPFMDECETELTFNVSGRVVGVTDRARRTIAVLNLGDTEKNNRALIEKRKQLSHALLIINGIDSDLGLEDEDLLEMVIDDLQNPVDGRLSSFAPVVVNILRGWMSA